MRTRSSRIFRTAFVGATALVAFAWGGTISASAAGASQGRSADGNLSLRSASGYGYFGSFSFLWGGATMQVPSCGLGHSINGSGKKIKSEHAWIMGAACDIPVVKFCNWRIDFAYADTKGKTYKTSKGKLHKTCNVAEKVDRKKGRATLPKYGKACAKLYVAGKRRAVQCHNIVK